MRDSQKIGDASTLSEFESMIQCTCPIIPITGFPYCEKESSTMSIVFRGQANKSFELTPSIFRNGHLQSENKIFEKGLEMVGKEFPDIERDFDKLAIMQHYGIPTRLLDFSLRPLIALYFACCDCFDKDGRVFLLRANDTKIEAEEIEAILKFISLESVSDNYFEDMRNRLGRMYPRNKLADMLNRDYLVYPYISNQRLKLQNGVFVIFGQDLRSVSKTAHNLTDGELRSWPNNSKSYIHAYLSYIDIPAIAKQSILSELNDKGINDNSVYPDGTCWKCILEEAIKNDNT